ncbi:SRPBCC family protein [Nocardioides sp. Kera G14]|uniref:SRPBCC family protein n=1 Tax=Nocardioides sp. Kera G14 TaxID=2884264 RepID=UPI001D108E87|nr:SRPBCC family protein [Nocardioides sp. Kera G14]UDY22521.1 SRPBCC family protein [Nocardioides sp. Kera G14]
MAEQTSSSIIVAASPAAVMEVIADFPHYPAWIKGMKSAEVVATSGDHPERAERVRFVLDVPPIKDSYTLAYDWKSPTEVSWTLVEATLLRSLDGVYRLRDLGSNRTEVTYVLTLDLNVPIIGMLKRKGEKILIETALKGLKTRVESLA